VSVLDASTYAEALTADTPLGTATRARIALDPRWQAPAILPAEVLSAIRGLLLAGGLGAARADDARFRLRQTRIDLYPFVPFERRVWELRSNLTVYDAWYVALAEHLGQPLVTTDRRLGSAPGVHCEIELVAADEGGPG